ncbi:MAG TPA: hypothetical protein VNH83_07995, partial [Bryobacteraceae bacterium]|nr:hypothetical protein [Bryobacteraceae bacterium]
TSGFISYRHNPGPATDKIATDNNSLIFTNKSLSAGQITPGTFGAGAYSLSGSSLTLPGSGSFDANGVLTLPTASATREYLVIGSGTKPTSPVTGGVWMANTGTYKGLGYKGPGGSTWTVPAIQDSGLVTGDQLIYNSEWQRFAGPTSSTPAILTSTGTGSAANPPAWTPAAWATTTPTGTGNLVLQTTPTLSTPSLGTNPYTATFTAGGASCCTQSQWSVQLLGTTSGASRVSQNGGTLNGLIGVSVNGNSNAGAAAEIELGGMSSVQTDGATTAGDYLIASITGNGQVHDAGSTWPTDPSKQVLGRILSTNASSGTFTALMFGPELRGIPVAASDLSNGATGSGAVVLASALPLSGTTGSIGGGLLTVGTCASGTASVTGATTSMAVSASPVTYPGDGNYWVAYVSSSNTVTVKVCATATLTPTASNYNVRVIQ